MFRPRALTDARAIKEFLGLRRHSVMENVSSFSFDREAAEDRAVSLTCPYFSPAAPFPFILPLITSTVHFYPGAALPDTPSRFRALASKCDLERANKRNGCSRGSEVTVTTNSTAAGF